MIKFSIEEYQNLVSLLKQALLFYADKKNYNNDEFKSPKIIIDNGSQAEFALNKINELEQMYLDTMKEYKSISEQEALEEFKNISGSNDESWQDMIEKIKNIK